MASNTSPMTGESDRSHRTVDYAGAVYGSLLAASVVAGSSPGGNAPAPVKLTVLLLATGIVFWLAHVYSQLIGDRMAGTLLTAREIRTVAAGEWPIVQASVPPAVAVSVGALAGLSDSGAAWLALLVALAGQLGWGLYAAVKAGASGWIVVVSGAVNLVLGVVIVLLKVVVTH